MPFSKRIMLMAYVLPLQMRKVCINDIRTSTVTNKEIMSSPLITIDSNSAPSIAAHMMLQTNIKHLLVVDKSNVNKPVCVS